MKAMVLCAGLGTRLRPLTQATPKCLVPVANIPIILYNLFLLHRAGIKEIAVNLHHLPDKIKAFLKDGEDLGFSISYSHEKNILGTAGGLKKMEAYFDNSTFLVINSDILIDIGLTTLIERHQHSGAIATMVLRQKDAKKYGIIRIDEQCVVRDFLDKLDTPPENTIPTMFTGIQMLEPRVFEYILPQIFTGISDYTYPKMLDNSERVMGHLFDGYWIDTGSLERYLEASRDILEGRFPRELYNELMKYAKIPGSWSSDGIFIGENTHIDPSAELKPPVIIGSNTNIGADTSIGPYCVIGNRVQIEENCHLQNSVIWDTITLSAQSYFEESVLFPGGVVKMLSMPEAH